MFSSVKAIFLVIVLASATLATANARTDSEMEAVKQAFENSEYPKAVQLLQILAVKNPGSAEVQWWLARSYYELEQRDATVNSAEKAVSLEPQSSVYHEWLGRAYGEKADHSAMFSAMSLARKTRKEFEKAVELDEKNFTAMQELIEFDCAAPGIVGGGEDKARPEIARLAALDVAEGHYAAGNCRRQKKDFEAADAEFTKALESNPKSAEVIYDIGDYAVKRAQPERLMAVVAAGERVNPRDPREKFYKAVALVMKNENPEEAERLLREYVKIAPTRTGFPRPAAAHVWIGKLLEHESKSDAAVKEFEAAVKLDPKYKPAQEELKRAKKGKD
jgi:tetratricopeptide (TPR) repeat protein